MPNLTPSPLNEADYEAIQQAVMETARGRWFLAEFTRRNRNADTTMLLKALERIEANVRGENTVGAAEQIRFDLVEMSNAIARTKAEIAAIKPDVAQRGKFAEAGEELDCVVQATEAATSDILACAERIQEIAWTMREQGMAPELCDLIDEKATEVYTACSFQDITGQRTRKVIGVLRYLESRINAMIEIWGLDGIAPTARPGATITLLHGPARPGQGLDQADVDAVMGPAVQAGPIAGYAAQPAYMDAAGIVLDERDLVAAPELRVVPSPSVTPMVREEAPPSAAVPRAAQPVAKPADPLAPIAALSAEEKLALFS